MAKYRLVFYSVCFLAGAMIVSGCKTAKPDGLPDLSPCKITVTQDSKPVEGVQVLLSAKGEEPCPWSVGGYTDASGVAKIQTHGQYAGAPRGTFRVVLAKTVSDGKLTVGNEHALSPGNASRSSTGGGRVSSQLYSIIDTQYTAEATTPLEVTVGKGAVSESFEIGPAVHIQLKSDGV